MRQNVFCKKILLLPIIKHPYTRLLCKEIVCKLRKALLHTQEKRHVKIYIQIKVQRIIRDLSGKSFTLNDFNISTSMTSLKTRSLFYNSDCFFLLTFICTATQQSNQKPIYLHFIRLCKNRKNSVAQIDQIMPCD